MPDDMKAHVKQALSEATTYEREETAKEEEHILSELKKFASETKKLEIIELNADQKGKWAEAMKPIYSNFYSTIGQDLIEKTINTK